MMDVAPSAHRHRVAVEDMWAAVRGQVIEVEAVRAPYFRMIIGPARDGSWLEIGILDPAGEPLIIHAMPLRRNWRRYVT